MTRLMEPSEFCREVETYLCRKNDGHLVRIVGPAFEKVCGWALLGVPLKIALRGVDQYCERYYAKGPRRRPVRIEFCEADILDLFDRWRRAVGVTGAAAAAGGSGANRLPVEDAAPRKPALASHIERVIARLTAARGGGRLGPACDDAIAEAVRELDQLATDARHARGEARAAIIDRLGAIDRDLIATSLAVIDQSSAATLRREAELELAPFGSRMAPEARAGAVDVAFARLVRESLGLPVLVYE